MPNAVGKKENEKRRGVSIYTAAFAKRRTVTNSTFEYIK